MSEQKPRGHYIRFPHDPELLARYCQRKALLFEGLSGIVILGGVFLNFILFWIVIIRVI
jgi:hypothetical protein